MENAAKALIIAGGILLAIMTLTLLVYGITSTGRIEQARAESEKTEELANFNMEYEAYNKKRMYGVDVITVINKAINHNKAMKATNIDDPYYINITFITKEDFKNELYVRVYNETDKKVDYEKYGTTVSDPHIPNYWTEITSADLSQTEITSGVQYTLLSFSGNNAIMNKDFTKIFDGYKEDITKTTLPETKLEAGRKVTKTTTCTLYSALTNFKRAIFQCTNVDYSPQTGRIESMTFEQYKKNEEIY